MFMRESFSERGRGNTNMSVASHLGPTPKHTKQKSSMISNMDYHDIFFNEHEENCTPGAELDMNEVIVEELEEEEEGEGQRIGRAPIKHNKTTLEGGGTLVMVDQYPKTGTPVNRAPTVVEAINGGLKLNPLPHVDSNDSLDNSNTLTPVHTPDRVQKLK
eukprot:UN23416